MALLNFVGPEIRVATTGTARAYSNLMRNVLASFFLMWVVASVYAQQDSPVFTAEYYLANADSYLGKTVTVPIAYVTPRNENRDDGMRELDAQTGDQRHVIGRMMIIASPAAATRLITVCGTNPSAYTSNKRTMVQGVFLQESTGLQRYYLLVEH